MAAVDLDQAIATIRRFNRFYTTQIGVLSEGLLNSTFSLTEARVLYELAHRHGPTATGLSRELRLDLGYLSRILRSFEERGLISRTPSASDGRQNHLWLTDSGRAAFAPLDKASRDDVAVMLTALTQGERAQLLQAMDTIESVLAPREARQPPCVLRPHQPGDLGWVVHRHGVLYAQEYGWDERFEALVAEIVAGFVQSYDPKRERCWIAELDGEIVGSVFLMRASDTTARLRLLLVEPRARGLGIGKQLVAECTRFARQVGYRKISLWTNSVLLAAREIYRKAGYKLVREEAHHSFGHDLVGETWELDL